MDPVKTYEKTVIDGVETVVVTTPIYNPDVEEISLDEAKAKIVELQAELDKYQKVLDLFSK